MTKQTYKITCQYCKKPFESAVFWARYCSISHRQMDYAKRKREAERQAAQNNKSQK